MAPMARSNPKSGARDMIISMAVILVPVLVLVLLFSAPGDADNPVGASATPKVDIPRVLEIAEAESPYPLLVAGGLDDGWIPLRVGWAQDGGTWITGEPAVGDSWQVGYLGPDGIYYGVQQRNAVAPAFITATTREGRAVGGEVDLVGRTWLRYESKDGRTRSLVSERDDSTAVVSADTDFMKLEAFTATLVEVGPTVG